MFKMIAFYDQSRAVPFTWRFGRFDLGWNHCVERTGIVNVIRPAQLRVSRIVDQLEFIRDGIFLSGGTRGHLGTVGTVRFQFVLDRSFKRHALWNLGMIEKNRALNPILHTSVATRRNAPIELQLEVLERLLGYQVFGNARLRSGLQSSILD